MVAVITPGSAVHYSEARDYIYMIAFTTFRSPCLPNTIEPKDAIERSGGSSLNLEPNPRRNTNFPKTPSGNWEHPTTGFGPREAISLELVGNNPPCSQTLEKQGGYFLPPTVGNTPPCCQNPGKQGGLFPTNSSDLSL